MPGEPPQMGREHGQEREHHHGGAARAPGGPRGRGEQKQQTDRAGKREGGVFRPERQREEDARQRPVARARAGDCAVREPAGKRPERQLHLVVRELDRRKVEEVKALEREHGDQGGEWIDDLARQPPHEIHRQHRRERAEQIDRVDIAGEPVGGVGQPPRQRRMLPVAELPFLAERKILDQVELEVGTDQDRHQRPDHEVRAEHEGKHRAGLGPRMGDRPVKRARGRACGEALHAASSLNRAV